MQLRSTSFSDQQPIPERYAFCKIDPRSRVDLSENLSPQLTWSNAPENTRSFVLICHDPDAPSKPDDVNVEDREISADLPRVDFYHWALIDINPSVNEIAEGEFSRGVTPRGKAGPTAPRNMRHGVNDYTSWFASDRDMNGDYYGYDGPCPPWNDSVVHRYVFTVYALDIDTLPLEGKFTGPDVVKALEGHVLAKASLTGLYTLNPRLRGQESSG